MAAGQGEGTAGLGGAPLLRGPRASDKEGPPGRAVELPIAELGSDSSLTPTAGALPVRLRGIRTGTKIGHLRPDP